MQMYKIKAGGFTLSVSNFVGKSCKLYGNKDFLYRCLPKVIRP